MKTEKRCNKCNEIKRINQLQPDDNDFSFYGDGKDKYLNTCKTCRYEKYCTKHYTDTYPLANLNSIISSKLA